MPRDDYLFSRVNWFSVDEHQKTQLKKDVANYDGNRLLNTAVDDLSNYFAEKYRSVVHATAASTNCESRRTLDHRVA